jgi:hypothetical protein
MTRYKKAKKFTKIQKGLSRNIQTVKIVLIITMESDSYFIL